MSLSVGIVGLPNVGKSTLFNALLKRQQAYVANFPFATIEPNIGIVPVPNNRLGKLAEVVKNEIASSPSASHNDIKVPEVPATVEFIDIAGLIAGAHKGEGLGNKFLAHIREADAVCHVVRAFTDPDIIREGSVDPKADLEIIETELKLADYQTLEKQKSPGNTPDKTLIQRFSVITKLKENVEKGIAIRDIELNGDEKKVAKELGLLTAKPILVVLNVDENDLREGNKLEFKFASEFKLHASQVIAISAKVESELASLDDTDQRSYLSDLGVKESGLERLIKKAFETLGLITFLTAGEKEVRAWTIRRGMNAPGAAGVIHTDFEKNFIKADICNYNDFIGSAGLPADVKGSSFTGGWKNCRESGKVRSEGKDYIMKDGDVVEFKIGT